MSYTAFKTMRQVNKERFGKDLGPKEPALYRNRRRPNDLKSSALRFLHERCEGLRFVDEAEAEFFGALCTGRSISSDQIPYNMQMDIDRLCLERELGNFIDSGTAEDAYTVYYCFLEMFIGRYGASQSMIELLSEFESNASSLLMKHRDHYSHSVYVFALGLAIYENNEKYRGIFRRFYKDQIGFKRGESEESKEARTACFFLEYWGLTSLFHDIGCFYTDKPVDFDMLTSFTQDELDMIAPMEHDRWVREHIAMSWSYGTEYEDKDLDISHPEKFGLAQDLTEKQIRAALREQTRRHKLTMDGNPTTEEIKAHYDQLPPEEQGKDWKPMKSMLKLIKKYDGLRIYRINSK